MREYLISCSRASAYHTIGLAKEIVHGSLDFEYCLVEPYLHRFVELNPQSVCFTKFFNYNHFIRAGLGPSVSRDFLQSALPVIAIDMSHLQYVHMYMLIKGQLALAVGMDGNRQIFPFFLDIHPSENKKIMAHIPYPLEAVCWRHHFCKTHILFWR